jgi:hypothetical protein
MRRTGVIVSIIVMLVALALPALAAGPSWSGEHSHVLKRDGQCVELASGQFVPRHAHHESLHLTTLAGGVFGPEHGGFTIAPGTCP